MSKMENKKQGSNETYPQPMHLKDTLSTIRSQQYAMSSDPIL